MRWLLVVLLLWPLGAFGQDLPADLAKRVKSNPVKLLADVTELIAAYGHNGRIDRAAMDDMVALARAGARATALRRLQGADLNADGAIGGAELAVASAAASATVRGRLAVNFAAADRDGDGAVAAAELAAYAGAEALDAYDEARVSQLHALLAFDGNGDGAITLAEVSARLAQVASAAGQTREIENQFQIKRQDDQGDQPGQQGQPQGRDQFTHLAAI